MSLIWQLGRLLILLVRIAAALVLGLVLLILAIPLLTPLKGSRRYRATFDKAMQGYALLMPNK